MNLDGAVHAERRPVSSPEDLPPLRDLPSSTPASGADLVVARLRSWGIRHLFLVPGAQLDPLIAAADSAMSVVVAGHECAAGFMADGYARISRGMGVCAAIGGPGASNLLTAATTARLDESSVVFLTGNVPTALFGCGAFQDGSAQGSRDLALFAGAITHAQQITSSAALGPQLDALRQTSQGSVPGPVHLALPLDIQRAQAADVPAPVRPTRQPGEPLAVWRTELLDRARRPVLLLGPRACGSPDTVRRFVEAYGIPAATSLSAKGLLPEDHPLSLGNFGYAGSRRASAVLLGDEPDLLIVVGMGLNERDTLQWDSRLLGAHRSLMRIDPRPPAEPLPASFAVDVRGDCTAVLAALLPGEPGELRTLKRTLDERTAWLDRLAAIPRQFDPPPRPATARGLGNDEILTTMRKVAPREAALFVDAGAHRLFAGHYWQALSPGRFFLAHSNSAMGWAIAAAIGAKLARPDVPMLVLTGDGCMRMHCMELATCAHYGLAVVFVLVDNHGYGSVYRRLSATGSRVAEHARLPPIDWLGLALGMGCRASAVDSRDALAAALADGLGYAGPSLILVDSALEYEVPDALHATLSYGAVDQ